MKKISQSLIAIFAMLASYCQTNQLPLAMDDLNMSTYLQKRGAAHLHIKITKNTKRIEGVIVKYTTACLGPEFQKTGFTKLDVKGEADIVLSDQLPYQQLWLDIEGYVYAGLLVNTDLALQIDASKLGKNQAYLYNEALTFKGTDAVLNYFTSKKFLFQKKEQDQLNNILTEASIKAANKIIPINQFLKTADSVYQNLKKINKEYAKENPGMYWAIANETNSFYFSWVLTAFLNKKMPDSLYKELVAHRPYFTSNDGVGFYREMCSYITSKSDNPEPDLQKALYAKSKNTDAAGKTILDSITTYEALAKNDKSEKILKRLYAKRYKIFSKEINRIWDELALSNIDQCCSMATADILKLQLMERAKDHFSETYPEILNSMKTDWTKVYVQKQFEEYIEKQGEINELFKSAKSIANDNYYIGKPVSRLPFNASLFILDSIKNIDEFIVTLKNKFKNKALILDFWATWCVPCIGDLPNSKKLHEENENLPIEYIYLCTSSGSDTATWKKRIGTLKIPGTHIFMSEELMSALRKKFNAEGGYPTYVVIDAKGNINSKIISFMGQLNLESLKAATGID